MKNALVSGSDRIDGTAKNLLKRLRNYPEFAGLINPQGLTGGCLSIVRSRDITPGSLPQKNVVDSAELVNQTYADAAYREAVVLVEHPEYRLSNRGERSAAVRGNAFIIAFAAPNWSPQMSLFFVVALAVASGDLAQNIGEKFLKMASNPYASILKTLSLTGLVPGEAPTSNQ